MGKIMTNLDLVKRLKDIADNYKTIYANGAFGWPITDYAENRLRTSDQTKAWYAKGDNATKIRAVKNKGYFGFDCVNLLKALLWGWNGNYNHHYGGATYPKDEVPTEDFGSDDRSICTNISTDFSKIEIGEEVHIPGHVGYYIGNGLVIECTPKGKNCVQYSALGNIGAKGGNFTRTWDWHGKNIYIDYIAGQTPAENSAIKSGIAASQRWINGYLPKKYLGKDLDDDGICGVLTRKAAVQCLQYWLKTRYNPDMAVDGGCGKITQKTIKDNKVVVRLRDHGDIVYIVQVLLYCNNVDPKGLDGSFGVNGGTGCRDAVLLFQRQCGLEDDAEVGVDTFTKLCWR